MKNVLAWILFATPAMYVALMKLTGQPVEVSVLVMLVPFIAAPFVLARLVPKDEEVAKRQALDVIATALRGGHPPSRSKVDRKRP